MEITVNGEPREFAPGTSVAELVERLGGRPDGRGVAVAIAAEVVPRSVWAHTILSDGARVEVLAAVQGG
jgi:sulfur carrier protein